jgi:hypothetical protein
VSSHTIDGSRDDALRTSSNRRGPGLGPRSVQRYATSRVRGAAVRIYSVADTILPVRGPTVPSSTLVQCDQVTVIGDGSHERPLHTADSVPGSLVVADEGVLLPGAPHTAIDFVGDGVVARDAGGGVARVSVPGVMVRDDGVPVPGKPHAVLDFVGDGVVATDAGGGVSRVSVPGLVIRVDGAQLPGAPHAVLDFVGGGVVVEDTGGGVARVSVPGVTIRDEGGALLGTPHQVVDFVGDGIAAVDAGGGVARVEVDAPEAAPIGDAVLTWGLGIWTTTPAFLQSGGTDADPSALDNFSIVVPRDGVLRGLYARHNAAGGSGPVATYTVEVNGVPTELAVSVPTGVVGQAGNLTAQVRLQAGDRVSLTVTSDSFGPNITHTKVSVGFQPVRVARAGAITHG